MKSKLIIAFLLQCIGISCWAGDFPEMFVQQTADQNSNKYAIVVVGGVEETRHVLEGAKSYQFLRNVLRIPADHIRVCSGNNSTRDFDNDGKNDVNYNSTVDGVKAAFADLSQSMKSTDEFIFSAVDHGMTDGFCLYPASGNINFVVESDLLKSSVLSSLIKGVSCTKVNIWLHACLSGSFIDDLKNNGKNTTIITSTSATVSSRSSNYIGSVFFEQFYAALAGSKKIKYNSYATVATDTEADYNEDGEVSDEEAFVYAKDHDDCSYPKSGSYSYNEIPRYWSSETDWRFCRNEDWGIQDITEAVSGADKEYEAMYRIKSTSIISSESNVSYYSGKWITLRSGFSVSGGSNFTAELFDCEAEKQANEAELRSKSLDEQVAREEVSSTIALYPNPTTGLFSIDLGGEVGSIRISDPQGRVVAVYDNVEGSVECDLSGKSAGIYFVEVSTANETVVKKVVKQ